MSRFVFGATRRRASSSRDRDRDRDSIVHRSSFVLHRPSVVFRISSRVDRERVAMGGFWDSPARDVDVGRPTTWFRRALERATTMEASVTRATSVLDDAMVPAREKEEEEELRHLRRHVEALSLACAEANAEAKAGALAVERLEIVRRENASLRGIEAARDRAETRAKAAEARANAARDALVNAKLRHEEALKRAYLERDESVERAKIEVEKVRSECVCAHARVRALEEKNASLATENATLEGDVREYRAEAEHLDEIIAQAEDDLARVLAEKQILERELAAKSAASIKNLIKSPFSPLTTTADGTPRLAAAMRWIEDTIATPIRSPFADLKRDSGVPDVEAETIVPASATKRAASVGKSRLRPGASPLPKTPGAACEDSAEDAGAYDTDGESVDGSSPLPLVEPVVAPVTVKESRRWRFGFAKVPESRMYGVPLDRAGGFRLRIVGEVSLVHLVT